MYIRKKHHKNIFSIILSLIVIFFFSYFILAANNYKVEEKYNGVNANFLSTERGDTNGYIPLDNIISVKSNKNYKFTYIVQPGDSLSQIAKRFGVTVENIKETNGLKDHTLIPGQKLVITENKGFIHQLKKDYVLKEFTKKYNLDLEKVKKLNYIETDNQKISKGDELFLPISFEEAKERGIIEKEKEKKPERTPSGPSESPARRGGGHIAETYYYNPNIKNGFFPGHCTRYVAIKKFPYKTQNTQQKLWNGNGNQWFSNAKKAGYQVGQTPKKDAIAVLRYGGNGYTYYGHVGIVKEIDRENRKLLIDEMNAKGRFIVTKRRIPMDKNVIGYIYY